MASGHRRAQPASPGSSPAQDLRCHRLRSSSCPLPHHPASSAQVGPAASMPQPHKELDAESSPFPRVRRSSCCRGEPKQQQNQNGSCARSTSNPGANAPPPLVTARKPTTTALPLPSPPEETDPRLLRLPALPERGAQHNPLAQHKPPTYLRHTHPGTQAETVSATLTATAPHAHTPSAHMLPARADGADD